MSISCRQVYTTISRQVCQGQFIQNFLRFTDCHTSAAALVRNDMQFTVVLRCSKNEKTALSYNSKKCKNTQDNHVLGTFYLELLARFELATRFPRNRGFVEALRPRIEILSAYADRADEAASFRMEDIKNDQGQRVLVIFWSC